jgi:hypothetical protein
MDRDSGLASHVIGTSRLSLDRISSARRHRPNMSNDMRARSPVDTGNERPTKRQRRSGSFIGDSGSAAHFAANLLSASNVSALSEQYHAANPFKHVVIDKIFQESLLMKVKDEIVEHLSFTEKETDIYKASPLFDHFKLLNLLPQIRFCKQETSPL